MKKFLFAAAMIASIGAVTMPIAKADSTSDVVAGALIGGVLGYAIGQSNNSYNAPYSSYGPAPYYGAYPYYGYENVYPAPVAPALVTCSGLPGSRTLFDAYGNVYGVVCPDGAVQYYSY